MATKQGAEKGSTGVLLAREGLWWVLLGAALCWPCSGTAPLRAIPRAEADQSCHLPGPWVRGEPPDTFIPEPASVCSLHTGTLHPCARPRGRLVKCSQPVLSRGEQILLQLLWRSTSSSSPTPPPKPHQQARQFHLFQSCPPGWAESASSPAPPCSSSLQPHRCREVPGLLGKW